MSNLREKESKEDHARISYERLVQRLERARCERAHSLGLANKEKALCGGTKAFRGPLNG